MSRGGSVILAVLLALWGGGTPMAKEGPVRRLPFCPGCWRFLSEPGDVDLDNICYYCGKPPVELEAVQGGWTWCDHHGRWHGRPCDRSSSPRSEAFILYSSARTELLLSRAYCPGDEMIPDLGVAGVHCRVCSRPLVEVQVVERSWSWCRLQNNWLKEPCRSNPSQHCCTPSRGFLLVSRPGGLATGGPDERSASLCSREF